jgi:general stress protein YciG
MKGGEMFVKEDEGRGRGWHGDPEGHAQAGKKGGRKVARERDSNFFSEIGRKGGQNSPGKFEKGSERAREAGRKGGRS